MNRRTHRNRCSLTVRVLITAGAAVFLSFAATVSAQQRTTLRKIEVLGLQRVSSAQVIAASGLRLGDSIDASMIDAAADKLMRSGWFQTVDYRVRTADADSTVVFEVVEKTAAISVDAAETLGHVVWSGNSALSNEELASAFGLRAGEPTPKAKFDQAVERVRKAYARHGYINANVNVTRELEGRRTNYQFTVREGKQYRMGQLSVTGVTPAEVRQLNSKWTLAPNAIFDDGYLEQFRTTVLRPFVASRGQRTGIRSRFEINTKPDIQKQTVDVIISFK